MVLFHGLELLACLLNISNLGDLHAREHLGWMKERKLLALLIPKSQQELPKKNSDKQSGEKAPGGEKIYTSFFVPLSFC